MCKVYFMGETRRYDQGKQILGTLLYTKCLKCMDGTNKDEGALQQVRDVNGAFFPNSAVSNLFDRLGSGKASKFRA